MPENVPEVISDEEIQIAFRFGIEFRFDGLIDLVNHTEQSFLERLYNVEDPTDDATDEEKIEWASTYGEEHWQLTSLFPQTVWASFWVSGCSVFEYELNELCRFLKEEKGYTLGFKDLSGTGIFKAKNYLTKVLGIKDSFKLQEWEKIRHIF